MAADDEQQKRGKPSQVERGLSDTARVWSGVGDAAGSKPLRDGAVCSLRGAGRQIDLLCRHPDTATMRVESSTSRPGPFSAGRSEQLRRFSLAGLGMSRAANETELVVLNP
jgi:hypothetical protein